MRKRPTGGWEVPAEAGKGAGTSSSTPEGDSCTGKQINGYEPS
jgi:hypothetical protein